MDESDTKQIITQFASAKAIPLPKMQCTIFDVFKNHLGLVHKEIPKINFPTPLCIEQYFQKMT